MTGAFGYPVSLEVRGRRAVVIGREAATSKVKALLDAGANVRVIAGSTNLPEDPTGLVVERRSYRGGDLVGAFVCIASRDVGGRTLDAIQAEARSERVLLNVMDDPARCDFAAPATVRRGDLSIAIATAGRSPALARRLREELSVQFGPEWADLLDLLGEVRDETLSDLPDLGERARRWQRALDVEALLELLRRGRRASARQLLLDRLLREEVA